MAHPTNPEIPENETKSEEAQRLSEWLGKKAPYYCRPHGRRIIIFIDNLGGCKLCCESLIAKLEARKIEREKEKA